MSPHRNKNEKSRAFILLLILANILPKSNAQQQPPLSHAGDAGHALLFRDNGIVIENFRDLSETEFTFEAWIRSYDDCHRSALLSYALDSKSPNEHQRTADYNHFVIFDPQQLVACHGFEYIDLYPDFKDISCYSAWNHSEALPNIVSRDGSWHHLAVTWTAQSNGLTKIYVDGLLRAQTPTSKTMLIQPGGALMLGAEQDCYAGCTDRGQGFYGEMDEVRLWKVERSHSDILKYMRYVPSVQSSSSSVIPSELENHPDLAAYWRFNDPEEYGLAQSMHIARDASGRGNHIPLMTLPKVSQQYIPGFMSNVDVVSFRNNYAMNAGFTDMPQGDITIELWARTPEYNASSGNNNVGYSEFFSFATYLEGGSNEVFVDDALLIEKYTEEFRGTHWLEYKNISTAGSISVHINANREGMGFANDHWIDYNVGWIDEKWHHIAVTWIKSNGEVSLYFDGQPQIPFWKSSAGVLSVNDPGSGGVDQHIAAGTQRRSGGSGSLVLGSKQENFGGGFSPEFSLHGDMAMVRVWSTARTVDEIRSSMYTSRYSGETGVESLVFSYDDFTTTRGSGGNDATTAPMTTIKDVYNINMGKEERRNDLFFGGNGPQWVYSTAPLATLEGKPVAPPAAGAAGHALFLDDQQVLIHQGGFGDFPADEITVEFWMLSTDGCREGVPFSYALGGSGQESYGRLDNAFLIFNYNDWGISVMEDEGHWRDHTSGIAATDGKWHHIAVTWQSIDGATKLYDNGRLVWSVVRGKGKRIQPNGTLIMGREQDCEGGCFDSAPGSTGDISLDYQQEYGSQDFFGLIDEMRIWKKVRTQDQIRDGMKAHLRIKADGDRSHSEGRKKERDIDPRDPDLVAYWNFDEGQGYLVKDITGNNHHLVATQSPRWEVVKSLSTCGNGIVEGLEECDTGNRLKRGDKKKPSDDDVDGCSDECTVLEGWQCTRTSPSQCWKIGEKPVVPRTKDDTHGDADGKNDMGPKKKPIWTILAGLIVGICVVASSIALFSHNKDMIYQRYPIFEDVVLSVKEKTVDVSFKIVSVGERVLNGLLYRLGLGGRGAGRDGRGGYSYVGELMYDDASSDFTRSMPPPGPEGYSILPSARAPEGFS